LEGGECLTGIFLVDADNLVSNALAIIALDDNGPFTVESNSR
jgi:hypothetical protein